jgi:3-phenylpropionate/cinnamic acid dioxygenase small subunit
VRRYKAGEPIRAIAARYAIQESIVRYHAHKRGLRRRIIRIKSEMATTIPKKEVVSGWERISRLKYVRRHRHTDGDQAATAARS